MKNQTNLNLKFEPLCSPEKFEPLVSDLKNESDSQKSSTQEQMKQPIRTFYSSPCLLSEFDDS